MAVVDQEPRSDALPRAHTLQHHVETKDFHITDATASIALNCNSQLRSVGSWMEFELSRFSVQFLNNVAEGPNGVVENGATLSELLPKPLHQVNAVRIQR